MQRNPGRQWLFKQSAVFNSHLIYCHFQSTDTIIFFFCSAIEDSNMAEDLDIEAMLEAPYKKKVIIPLFLQTFTL